MDCPELEDMDLPACRNLDRAYSEGTWQGMSPEQLYDEWLQEYSDKHAVTCALCGEQHRCCLSQPIMKRLPCDDLPVCLCLQWM